jgi:pimeloyl-ACP methyl ester carboxylesterase
VAAKRASAHAHPSQGDDDPIIPLASPRIMARLLPNAQLRVVAGGGHLFLLDQPETVVDDIHRFLDA